MKKGIITVLGKSGSGVLLLAWGSFIYYINKKVLKKPLHSSRGSRNFYVNLKKEKFPPLDFDLTVQKLLKSPYQIRINK